jgi:hypothetical protein
MLEMLDSSPKIRYFEVFGPHQLRLILIDFSLLPPQRFSNCLLTFPYLREQVTVGLKELPHFTGESLLILLASVF